MKVCCGCQTNTCDTYYPTTCECLGTKLSYDNAEERKKWKYVAAAHFCTLSQNAPNDWYYDGLCFGCWKKMFEPTYKQVEKSLFRKVSSGRISSGKRYRRYKKTVYIKHDADPKCQWCSIPFEVKKCDEMDQFPKID